MGWVGVLGVWRLLLDLTGRGRGRLAAVAGGVDGLGRDEVQVLVVRDLVQAVAVLQQLDVQVLVDLLHTPQTPDQTNNKQTNKQTNKQKRTGRQRGGGLRRILALTFIQWSSTIS